MWKYITGAILALLIASVTVLSPVFADHAPNESLVGTTAKLPSWCATKDDVRGAIRAQEEGRYVSYMRQRSNTCIDIRIAAALGVDMPPLSGTVIEMVDEFVAKNGQSFVAVFRIDVGNREVYSWHVTTVSGA